MKYLPTNTDVDYSYKYGERNGLSPTTGNMLYIRGFLSREKNYRNNIF